MKEKELFLKAISTMLHSWGHDTPPEAFWALGDFVKFYEKETGINLNIPHLEDGNEWAEAVVNAIEYAKKEFIELDGHELLDAEDIDCNVEVLIMASNGKLWPITIVTDEDKVDEDNELAITEAEHYQEEGELYKIK